MPDEVVNPFVIPPPEVVATEEPPPPEGGEGGEVEEPRPEPEESAKTKCLKKIQGILAEYDNRESDVPHNSEYWTLCNQYRGMP